MGFIKAALALIGWAFLCLAILNIPILHQVTSRVLLVLLPGFLLGYNVNLFPDSLELNMVVWFAITAVVILPLTLLPRIKCAGIFMVTFVPDYAVVRIIVEKIIPIFAKDFQKTVWTTAIVWGVSLLCTVLFLIVIKEEIDLPELKRKWVKILDRVIASVIVAVSLLSPMLLYSDNVVKFTLAAAIVAVVQYFLDVLLFDWFVRTDFDPPPTEEEMEARARREARREKRRNSLPAKMARGVGRGVVGVAKFGLGTLHVGGKVVTGVANLMGADIDNPIPNPNIITDPYALMEKDYYERILPQREMEEEAMRIQKDTEFANEHYWDNC